MMYVLGTRPFVFIPYEHTYMQSAVIFSASFLTGASMELFMIKTGFYGTIHVKKYVYI